jgi:predicted DNA-binding WGR domain protein
MMIPIRLERREPDHNRLRFYTITVTRTLFDGWALVREWGRIGQPGTVWATWFDTEAVAIEAGVKIRRRKERYEQNPRCAAAGARLSAHPSGDPGGHRAGVVKVGMDEESSDPETIGAYLRRLAQPPPRSRTFGSRWFVASRLTGKIVYCALHTIESLVLF